MDIVTTNIASKAYMPLQPPTTSINSFLWELPIDPEASSNLKVAISGASYYRVKRISVRAAPPSAKATMYVGIVNADSRNSLTTTDQGELMEHMTDWVITSTAAAGKWITFNRMFNNLPWCPTMLTGTSPLQTLGLAVAWMDPDGTKSRSFAMIYIEVELYGTASTAKARRRRELDQTKPQYGDDPPAWMVKNTLVWLGNNWYIKGRHGWYHIIDPGPLDLLVHFKPKIWEKARDMGHALELSNWLNSHAAEAWAPNRRERTDGIVEE